MHCLPFRSLRNLKPDWCGKCWVVLNFQAAFSGTCAQAAPNTGQIGVTSDGNLAATDFDWLNPHAEKLFAKFQRNRH